VRCPWGKVVTICEGKVHFLLSAPARLCQIARRVSLAGLGCWLLLTGMSGQPRARRPVGGPGTARETSKVRRWGVSEISRRRPRRRGRIQRGCHRKRAGLGTKSAGSGPMENVMRFKGAMGFSDMLRGLGVSGFDSIRTLARTGLGFAEHRHFLVIGWTPQVRFW